MKESYKIERICTSCGNQQVISVTKREAAFELVDYNQVIGQQCAKCSHDKFSTSFERPNLNYDLLKEWSTNLDLYLMPQDEELLLADEMYLDMILQILDSVIIPDNKQNLLMDALCVIVYDNQKKDEQLKNRVIKELTKRRDKLKLADDLIMDYIKEVVFPQLEEK